MRHHAILLLLLILGTLARYDARYNTIAYKKYTQSQKSQKIEYNIIDKIVARNKKIAGATSYGKYYVQGTVSPELVLYDQWIYDESESYVEDIEDYGSFIAVGESIWQYGGFAVELYYKSDFSLYARKELPFFYYSKLYDIATYNGYIYVTGLCSNGSRYARIAKLGAGLNVIWDIFKRSCIGTSMVFVQKDAHTYVYVIAEIVGEDGFALIIIDTETGTIHDYQEYSIYDFKPRSAFMLDGYIYIFGSGSVTAAIRMDPITYEYVAIRWSKNYTYATQHNGVIYTVDNYDLLRKEQYWSRNLTELLGGDKANITSIAFGDFGSIYVTVELGGEVLKIIRMDDDTGEILSQLTISRGEWDTNAGAGIIVTGLNQQYQSRIFEIDTVENPGGTITYVRYILAYEDIISPTISILNPNNDTYIYDTVDISYSATDNESGIDHYEVSLDGGDWIDKGTTTSHTFTDLAEGEHWIYVKAVDYAGNEETITLRVIVDLATDNYEPYLGSSEWASGIWGPNNETSAAWINLIYGVYLSGKVTIRISLTDDYAVDEDRIGIALYANGVPIEGVLGYQYDSMLEKLYVWIDTQGIEDGTTCTLRVTAYDKAGNKNYQDYVFVVDNAYPLFRKFELDGQGYIGADGSYYYGGDYPTIIVTVNITDSADNLWNVSVKLGNQEIVFFYWNVDHWDYTYNSTLVTQINVYGNRSSIKFDINIDATKLVDGEYQLRIIARDDAGYSSEATKDITIDWTPPAIYEFYGVPQDPTIDNGVWDNYSVIDGQWNITYNISDGTAEINIYVNESGVWEYLVQLSSNVWDTTDPQFRNGIFKVELVAKDPLGNTNIMYYIIAIENDRPYPWMYINGTRLGINTAKVGGVLDTLLAIELAPGQGWPTGLKRYIVYIDDLVLYNIAFDGWRGWYEKWYNLSFILNETLLTPRLHDIKIFVWGMATWTYRTVVYQINYKPRVKITLLNETVYWGNVDLWFNVTDFIGRPLDGRLNITLGGELYSISVIDGNAVLSYVYLTPGTYTIDTTYYEGEGLDTNASFVLEVLRHPLTYSYALSKFAVNRSYSINLTNILDALDNEPPSGTLYFEVYWSYTRDGPWMLLYNVSYEGSAIMLSGAWIIDDLNGDGIIDDADGTLYIWVVVGGWYEADDIVVQRALLRGDYTISISDTQFYWGDITLQIMVDDTVNLDEDNYVVVSLGGSTYSVDIENGQGTLSMHIDNPGSYTLTVIYVGDVVNTTRTFTLEVLKHPVDFSISYPSVLYVGGYYELQLYDIIDSAIGNVPTDVFTINVTYTWKLPAPKWLLLDYVTISGSAYTYSGTWEVADLNGDGLINDADYYVYIRFTVVGNKYEGEKVMGPITIKQIPEIQMMQQSETLVYTDFGEFLIDTNVPQAPVQVYYWDNTYGWVYNGTWMTDLQGNTVARVYVPDVGTVKYKVAINETEHYQAYEEIYEFNAVAEKGIIQIRDAGFWRYSDEVAVLVYLEDDDGDPARNIEIQVKISDGGWIIIGQGTTNSTGYALILTTCWLGEGTYTLQAEIIEEKFIADPAQITINIQKEKVSMINATVIQSTLVVKILDDENQTLPGIPIEVLYNGTKIMDGVTNQNGEVQFYVAGYEGKTLTIRIAENPYCETKETQITIQENALGKINANKWIVAVFGAIISIIVLVASYRRKKEEEFEIFEGGEITLERTNSDTTYT